MNELAMLALAVERGVVGVRRLARVAGLPPSVVSRALRGEADPRYGNVMLLWQAFHKCVATDPEIRERYETMQAADKEAAE